MPFVHLSSPRSVRPASPQIDWRSPQAEGLVGCWPLTGHASDLVHGFNGTPINGVTFAAVPQHGLCASFATASDQYVDLGNPGALRIRDIITVSAWVRPASKRAQQVVAKDVAGERAYTLDLNTLHQARFYINGGSLIVIGFGSVLSVGTTYHLVGMYDQTRPLLRLYVDGVLQGSDTVANPSISDSTAPVLIGRRTYVGNEEPFDGSIWDVRIYHRFLEAGEVWDLYNPATRWDLYWTPTRVVYFDVAAAAARTALNTRSNPLGVEVGMGWRMPP